MRSSSSVKRREAARSPGAYPLAADLARPVGRVAMPRRPRLHASEGTVHVVGRCNNREFCFTAPADFRMLIAQLMIVGPWYLSASE
jgi:hypothetical protein